MPSRLLGSVMKMRSLCRVAPIGKLFAAMKFSWMSLAVKSFNRLSVNPNMILSDEMWWWIHVSIKYFLQVNVQNQYRITYVYTYRCQVAQKTSASNDKFLQICSKNRHSLAVYSLYVAWISNWMRFVHCMHHANCIPVKKWSITLSTRRH